jgi:DNA-binding CsgD family transcriptional regulator
MRAAGRVPLVGRGTELDLVGRRLRSVLGGADGAQVVLVEGPAGIGKTRLVTEALAASGFEPADIRWGAAEELARDRAFWPLADALGCHPTSRDPELRAVADLLLAGVGDEVGPLELLAVPQHRFVILEAILGLVEELATRRPLALVVDDLQWADPSTLLALKMFGRRLTSLPIAIVATLRPEPVTPGLRTTVVHLTTEGADLLRLGPLPDEAIVDLVADLVEARPGAALMHELAGAAGSPLFIIELVRGLLDEGALRVVDGESVLAPGRLPASFRLAVDRRVGTLPGPAQDLLRVAAVLGSTFAVGDLAAAMGRPALSLLDPLDDCRRAGLLTDGDGGLGFHHDLVRESIYQDLPASLQRQLHLEIGRTLAGAGTGTGTGVVAHHLARGAAPGDEQAVAWLHRAGREASASAPAAAVDLLEKATGLATTREDRAALAPDLAQALLWAGRPADGEAVARTALTTVAGADDTALHLVLATGLFAAGRMLEGVQEVDRVVARSDPSGHAWAQLRAEAALGRLLTGDVAGAEREAAGARLDALAGGVAAAASLATAVQASTALATGRLGEAVVLAEQAAEMVDEGEASRYAPHFFLGVVLCSADRLGDAEAAFERGRTLSEGTGSLLSGAVHHAGFALRRFLAGEWDDARAEAETGLALAHERGTGLVVCWLQSMVALMCHRQGDTTGTVAALAAANGYEQVAGPQFGVEWLMTAKALACEDDDPALALTLLSNTWDLYSGLGVVNHCLIVGPDLVRLTMTAGDPDRAVSVTAEVERAAERTGVDSARGAALRCRGLVAGDPELLLAASDAYEEAGRPFESALAAEDAAVALLGLGLTDRARPVADRAVAVYERLGAARSLERARPSLRTLDRRPRQRRGARATVGWPSLTPTEHRVVALVATGLSNRAIGEHLHTSRRTVETHVSHVFTKLDLTSRAELAAEATRRQLADRTSTSTST